MPNAFPDIRGQFSKENWVFSIVATFSRLLVWLLDRGLLENVFRMHESIGELGKSC
jgi:hypothetical protein